MSGRRGGFIFRCRSLLPFIVFDAPMLTMKKIIFSAQSSSGGLKALGRGILLVLPMWLLACGDGYPPCAPEDNGDVTIYGPAPSPLPGPGGPNDPPDWADAPTKYSRNEEGQVCTCGPYQPGCTTDLDDLSDDELGGISTGPDACELGCGSNNSGANTSSGADNQQIQGFSPSIFKFVTTIPDDGTGKAGGWQVAATTLKFFRWISFAPEAWMCSITVEMPLRTELLGKISTSAAAKASADVATEAADKLAPLAYPRGIFCTRLSIEMQGIFNSPKYQGLGARVH